MPAWRSPDLESIFGGPLDDAGITESSLQRLVDEDIAENDQLDFKAGSYGPSARSRPAWTDEQELAKDVAAFANCRGGVILLGVEDQLGAASNLRPLSVVPEVEERRLRQALRNYQAPLADCTFVWVRASAGAWYVAVVVPPSKRSPHAVLGDPGDDKRPLRYPVRHGADTMWLTEPEVAERYRRRLFAQQDEEARTQRILSEGWLALRQASGVWLYVAVIPESPVEGRLDDQAVRNAERWDRDNQLVSPLQRSLPTYGRGIAAPGRITFTGGLRSAWEDDTEIRDAYVELHVDGSSFVATPIAARTEEDASRNVGEITLADDGILLVDVAVRWAAHSVGAWGMATVVAGLADAPEGNGVISDTVTLVESDDAKVRRIHGTRQLAVAPRTSTVVDLRAAGNIQQRLAVTYRVLAGLLQWFGLAEPRQLLPDGTIVPAEFRMSNYREVERWARANEVDARLLRQQ
jgi:hypothetical protein